MHELPVARDIVARAVDVARQQGSARVVALHVILGPDGAFESDALTFSIQAACRGTLAEGARVEIARAQHGGVVLDSVEVAGEA